MKYTLDQYAAIKEAVVKDGGVLMDGDVCTGSIIEYKEPGKKTPFVGHTQSCGADSIVIFPYEPGGEHIKDQRSRGAGFARVCLICDDVGRWPKYQELMSDWIEN